MPQTYETLLLEKRDRVAIITINRPDKRNALNIKTREEGAALLDELRNDTSVGVVVFTGLTAWHSQRLKEMAVALPDGRVGAYAVVGALSLYLDFINLFLTVLRLVQRLNRT